MSNVARRRGRSMAVYAGLGLTAVALISPCAAAAQDPVKFWGDGGVPVSMAQGFQFPAGATTDGSGGTIFAFVDGRPLSSSRVFVQRLDASGRPLWGPEGLAVAPSLGADARQEGPVIVSDTAGGAIVAWVDYRSGRYDVYAQRVGPDGTVRWSAGGRAACGNVNPPCSQPRGLQIADDGAGGAIIAWSDVRDAFGFSVWAQRFRADGTSAWTQGGVVLASGSGFASDPKVASDRAGGAVVVWQQLRTEGGLFAQRLDSGGVALWEGAGVPIAAAIAERGPRGHVVQADSGGAIVAWVDGRNGPDSDLYAQKLADDGRALWAAGGVAASSGPGNQYSPALVSDGAGGAILAWEDQGASPPGSGQQWILAQRIGFAGAPLWTTNGVVVSSLHSFGPQLVEDGSGGALVVFDGLRPGASGFEVSILAQHVAGGGDVLWPGGSYNVYAQPGGHYHFGPRAVSDGAGGMVVYWQDYRFTGEIDTDVFANRVNDQADPPAPRSSDLSVATTAPASATVGTDLTYTLTVTNGGPDEASLVALNDTVPPATTLRSASTASGPCPGYNTVSCNLGTIPSGASVTATLVVRAEAGLDAHNVARVAAKEADPDLSNNVSEVTSTVVYPVPVIDSLTPASVVVGGSGIAVRIRGQGFYGSSMRWNGEPRGGTTFGPNELAIDLSAADVGVTGTGLITVVNPAPGGGTSNAAVFTVRPVPTLSIDDVAVAEGDAGTHHVRFAVALTHATERTVTVRYTTSAGTATPGTDYEPVSGTLTFAPGVTSLALDVPVRGDALNEDDESFFVDLSDAAEAGLARAQGQATILNDDPLPTLSVGDLRVKEGGLPATFTVSLSAASARTVTVDYATSDGSATAGSDYQAVSGTLTFPPGLRTRKVSVPLLDDAWVEGTEGFLLKLAGPVLASLGRAQAMAMVVDDDRRPRAFRP